MPYLRKISRENSDGKKLLCGYDNGGRTGPNHFDFSRCIQIPVFPFHLLTLLKKRFSKFEEY